MLENRFKSLLRREIEQRLPGCLVLHLDPSDIQGIPDMLVLYEDRWAALEGKKNSSASHRPNQDYYVRMMNDMSFAAFIYPENREEVLDAMERSLTRRP